MNTSHITHVVLYSKNFYRHTGDVVKDMQRFMQMDGHSYKSINTPEKVVDVMQKDYDKWADSLDESYNPEHIKNDRLGSVAWADGAEARIWHFLNSYSIFIPMTSKVLGYPKYDQYHLPQFETNQIFNRGMSFDEMNATAKKYLDKNQVEKYDKYMNDLLLKFNFEKAGKVFGIHPGALEDEMWEGYEKFMDEHSHNETDLDQGYFVVCTKHFRLTFNTNHYKVDIDAHCKVYEYTVEADGKTIEEGINKVFDIALNSDEFSKSVNKAVEANSICEETEFYQCSSTLNGSESSLNEIKRSFFKYDVPDWEKNGGKNSNTFITGGHAYELDVDLDKGTYKLTISLIGISSCVAEENEIFVGGFINSSKF